MQERAGAQWAPDPFGRHELRYWDGSQWSEHVSDEGRTSIDTPLPAQRPRVAAASPGTTHHPVINLDAPVAGSPGRITIDLRDDVDAMAASPTRSRSRARSHAGAPAAGPAFAAPSASSSYERPPVQQASYAAGDDDVVAHLAAPAPSAHRNDLVDELMIGTPETRSATSAAPGPGQALDHEPEVWDWRESKVPELLSGLAVALLIGLAAFFGGGGGADDAGAARSEVSAPAVKVPSISGAQASTRKTAPKAKISSATGRTVRTSRSTRPSTRRTTTAANTTTTSATRTRTPPTSTPTTTPTTTEPQPTDSSSTSDSTPSESTSSTPKPTRSTSTTSEG